MLSKKWDSVMRNRNAGATYRRDKESIDAGYELDRRAKEAMREWVATLSRSDAKKFKVRER